MIRQGRTRNTRIWDIQGWPERLSRVYKGMFRGRELGRNKAKAVREGYKRVGLV